MDNQTAKNSIAATKKNTSKVMRSLRKRALEETDALGEEVSGIQSSILESIVIDGQPREWGENGERAKFSIPKEIPPLATGYFYYIKDETSDGVFSLIQIVSGQTTLFVFKNCMTGTKTTFTPHSIRDLAGRAANCIKPMKPSEVEQYRKEYFGGHIISTLGPKKNKRK